MNEWENKWDVYQQQEEDPEDFLDKYMAEIIVDPHFFVF